MIFHNASGGYEFSEEDVNILISCVANNMSVYISTPQESYSECMTVIPIYEYVELVREAHRKRNQNE